MKVAHVTTLLSKSAAGLSAVVEALSGAQADAGHKVHVFGLVDTRWEQGDRRVWAGAPADAFQIIGPRQIGYAPALSRALARWDPDIVHMHGLWTWPSRAALIWHKATGRPLVVSPHGMLSKVALSYSPQKKWIARKLFQDEALSKATSVLTTSDAEAGEVRTFGFTGRVDIVPNGVVWATRPGDLPVEPGRRVLSLGRLHKKKGLDQLIEAWAKLEAEFPDWSLDLVGPDQDGYGDQLRGLAARLNVARVTVRPPIFGPDRDRCMAGAELFVLPTLSENFALTVAESLMLEVPVISTKGAPWAGLEAKRCGRWVDHGPEPLARAMRDLMCLMPEERRAMGRRGRDWMLSEFSWPVIARRTLDLYEGLR